jgi:thiamine-monophosphate kinase
MLVEGVHFHFDDAEAPGYATPYQVGRKSLAVNLSDLAAMAAVPAAVLVAVAVNSERPEHDLRALFEGLLDLAQRYDVPVVGGDTNATKGPLTISVTVLGNAGGTPWLRSGAEVGDHLWVTGCLGGSLLTHHLHFEPRVKEAAWLSSQPGISAAMDISDGLSVDLPRLVEASQCGAMLIEGDIPISAAAQTMATIDGRRAVDHALHDGEDFELLLAVAPQHGDAIRDRWPFEVDLTRIGVIQDAASGLQILGTKGVRGLTPKGYLHR